MLEIFLTIGFISIIISGISIGAWTNGSEQRANFHSETKDHRDFRTKLAFIFGIIGLLSLSIAGVIYFIK